MKALSSIGSGWPARRGEARSRFLVAAALFLLAFPGEAKDGNGRSESARANAASSPKSPNAGTETTAEARAAAAKARQKEAEVAGKRALAERLSALVAQWNRVADAQRRAIGWETQAATAEQKNHELEAQVGRTMTLVEQTEARRARALARLRELGLTEADAPIPEPPAAEADPKPAPTDPGQPAPSPEGAR